MNKMQQEIEETVKSEVQMLYRMSGVMVQMLLYEAEQQNTLLKNVEVAHIENYKALEQIKDYENISKIDGAFNSLNLNPKKKPGLGWNALGQAVLAKHQQLTSLGD